MSSTPSSPLASPANPNVTPTTSVLPSGAIKDNIQRPSPFSHVPFRPSANNGNMKSPSLVGPPGTPPENPAMVELRHFLANAPRLWTSPTDPPVRKFKMGNGEEISCVFWKGRFFVTGTDVVKILIFRFQQLGRGILNPKKFEEGVFSDLRNLKPGTEAVLEEPRSEFLEFLHKHGCIRTQKKQKVFFWHKVPHDDLFREALERNLKRVTNVFNWTQMMSSPEMVKQCMIMQAAANGQVLGSAPPTMVIPSPAGMMAATSTPFMPWMPMMSIAPPTGHPNHPAALQIAPSASAVPSPTTAPSYHQLMGREHPRRTISLSAIDFTVGNSANGTMNNSLISNPPSVVIADVNSTLSSPMFSNGPMGGEEGLALDMIDNLPVNPATGGTNGNTAPHPSTGESPAIKKNILFSPPSITDTNTNSMITADPSSPALELFDAESAISHFEDSSASSFINNSLFNANIDPMLMTGGGGGDNPNSPSLGPVSDGDTFWNNSNDGLTNGGTGLDIDLKMGTHLDSPLWNDLNMLMPPSVAPNLRDTEL